MTRHSRDVTRPDGTQDDPQGRRLHLPFGPGCLRRRFAAVSRPARSEEQTPRRVCSIAASVSFERPLGFVGDSRSMILISHESKTEPANYFTVDLPSEKRTRLTDLHDPVPQLTNMKRS